MLYSLQTLFVLLLFIAIGTGLVATNQFYASGGISFYCFCTVILILVIFSSLIYFDSDKDILIKMPIIFFCLLTLYVVVKCFNNSATLLYTFYIITLCFLLIMLTSLQDRKRLEIKVLFCAVMIISFLESVYCIFQYLEVFISHSPFFKVTGSHNNPNVTAIFLALSSPIFLFFFDSKIKRFPDPEVCTLVVCSISGYTVDRKKCECVPPPKAWYLDNDGDGYFATGVSATEKPEGNYTESTMGFDCDDTNPLKNVGSDCGYKMWYLDWDGDGYHSDSNKSADSPGVGWVLTTLGVDCDENDPTKNVYCGNKMWYTDSDNDGWYATLKSAENSPGPEWIDYTANPPKGQDCDDTKPSVNNICASIDDCAEIKKQLLNQKFKDMLSELSDSNTLNLHYETGYWQDRIGDFHAMEVNGTRAVSMPDDISSLQNINHVHMNNWVNEQGVLEASYLMPSPADIAKVYSLYDNSRSNGMDLGNTYVGNISSLGAYQMHYTGVADNLSTASINTIIDSIKSDENRTAYELAMFQNGDLAGLLVFMRDVLKRNDIALYKIDPSGASKIELDANNQIKITPCN